MAFMRTKREKEMHSGSLKMNHATYAPARPANMETLEPRLMLNGDWAGTWYFSGLEFDANPMSDNIFNAEPASREVQFAQQQDGTYRIDVEGIGPRPFVFEEQDGVLQHSYAGDDTDGGDGYEQSGSRMIPVADGVAVFVNGEAKYASDTMEDILSSTSAAGLMTRQPIDPTQRPWEGQYEATRIDTQCETSWSDDPGTTFEINQFDVRILNHGNGVYEGRETVSQEGAFLQEQGDRLIAEATEQDSDVYEEDYEIAFRGPDMLYVVGGEGIFSPDKQDLYAAEFWAFSLQPVEEPQPDLAGEVEADDLPEQLLPGDKVRVPVTVTNLGAERARGRGTVDLHLSTDDQLDAGDTLLVSASRQNLSLRPGQSRTLRIRATLPEGTPAGQQYILADIDVDNDVAESDETNNLAVGTIEVEEAYIDLAVGIGDSLRLPNAVVSGQGDRIKLPVELTNEGTVNAPRGERVSVSVYARPDDGGDDVLLETVEGKSVSNLRPGKTEKLNARFTLPAELDGNYHLVAMIDAFGAGGDPEPGNDLAVTNETIEVAEGYFDLIAVLGGKPEAPAAVDEGETDELQLSAEVINQGNLPLPRGQRVDVGFWLRPTDASGDDVHVETVTGVPVSRLRPGAGKTVRVKTFLPTAVESGSYQWIVTVDQADAFGEKYEDNNEGVADVQVHQPPFTWMGTWKYSGTQLDVDLDRGNVRDRADRMRIRIESAGAGEYALFHTKGDDPMTLYADGDALVGTNLYTEEGGSSVGRIVIAPIAKDVALVAYGEGWYQGQQWLDESFATLGVMQREGYKANPDVELDGEFVVQSWSVQVGNGGLGDVDFDISSPESIQVRMDGRDVEIYDPEIGQWQTFKRRGSKWELDWEGQYNGSYRSEHIRLYRGPADTYYALAMDLWFADASMQNLDVLDYAVALITPAV